MAVCEWRHRARTRGGILAVTALMMGAAPAPAADREPPQQKTVSVTASTAYDHGGFWRIWFGDGWRDVWSTPIDVPVLDLGSYAGGLEPFKAGGNQSKTLRLHGADGRTYVFRSTAKKVKKALPDDLKDTPLGGLIQDQTAVFHPSGHPVVAVLQDAAGVLQATPVLVYMPDDPRLGEYREDFANTLGQIEERPDESGKGGAFAGVDKISDAGKLLEKLEESMEDRLDSRDYLKVRLIDFIVGDTDRGADQLRFAKFEHGKHDVYRTIPRDRDYAFMKADGFLTGLAARAQPRVVDFDDDYPSLKSLLDMTQEFDRSQLVDLPWEGWEAVTKSVRESLTDGVIDRAVMQLPGPYREKGGALIATGLKARRDTLSTIARQFYLLVNEEAEVFASDEDEYAGIDRNPDGSVRVRLWRGTHADDRGAPPVFDRRFVPDETREIRVHLERGDDAALVRGTADRSINLRVIGGEGDDVLADSSRVAHGPYTHFYDAAGDNTFVHGSRTHVVSKAFATPPPMRSLDDDENEEPETNPRELSEERRGRFRDLMHHSEDVIEAKTGPGARDWGGAEGLTPMTGYRESGGILLGIGRTSTDYGFRRRPYAWRANLSGLVGLKSGDLGVQLAADRYLENSRWSLALFARATRLESNRFYGYGNDSGLIDPSLSLVKREELLVQPALRCSFGSASEVAIGPIIKYVRPEIVPGSPADLQAPLGTEDFGEIGISGELSIDRTTLLAERQSGFGINAGASGYPSAWDADQTFGEAHMLARVFIPLGYPTLALRAGGQRVWGDFPLHESAFIGGRWSLRGFRWNRFAGDASAYGAAEMRVPLFRMTLLTRGQLGVVGFADAGRVWMDGNSEGDWHVGGGGGLWFGSLGRQVSFTYARGDEDRVYFYYGMPF